MLIIQTVNQKSEQGHSEPFLCTAENGGEYFVKGKLSGRASQINEWLCACMAEAIGLPIAPFAQLEICEDLSGCAVKLRRSRRRYKARTAQQS